MKKLLLITAVLFSSGAWADCGNESTVDGSLQCMSKHVAQLKQELNQAYAKVYDQTEAKAELNNTQKAWNAYRESQCGNFTVADAGAGNSQIAYDLDCQIELIKSRTSYLKHIAP